MTNPATASAGGITRHFDETIPVGDETVSATRYEPTTADGPLPALLVYYPYRRDLHLTDGNEAHVLEYLIHHDYQVIVADMVGTGGSTGHKESFKQRTREGKEASQIIDWIARQEWCTGRIGMYGKSYGGQTALSAAAQRPDALKAIAPMHTSHESYRDFAYEGGIYSPFWRCGHWFPQMQALRALPPSIRDDAGDWAEVWKTRLHRLENEAPWMFQELEHDLLDEFWEDPGFDIDRIEVPTFAIGGWRDQFPAATIRYFERLPEPKRLLMGPWRHMIPHRGREFAIDARRQLVEWFDHFLKDRESGALDHAPIEFWTERNGGKPGVGVWRQLDRWPTVLGDSNDSIRLAFTPPGLVEEESFEQGTVEAQHEVDHSVGLHSVDYPLVTVPIDTNADDVRSLTFETEPLTEALEYTGTGIASVRVSANFPDPSIVVRVIDVGPNGHARIITHGRLKATHRDGHRETQPVEPGQIYRLEVPLRPRSHVFETDHRIRVAVSGDFFPLTVPARDEGSITVHSTPTDPSLLHFPGRGHPEGVSFSNTIEHVGPDESQVPVDATYARSERGEWNTGRENLGDEARFETDSSRIIELPQGGELDYQQRIRGKVRSDDGSTFVVSSETELELRSTSETATVRVESRYTRDHAMLSNRVTIDGRVTFDKQWKY